MQNELISFTSIRRNLDGKSRATLWRWSQQPDFPKVLKINGRNYCRTEDWNDYLAAKTAEGAIEPHPRTI